MKQHRVGIIMNGVTGRMGTNQHLMRSIVEIIRQGGVWVSPTESIVPDPVLVGRNEVKLKKLAKMSGVEKWTTDLGSVLADPDYEVYFDAQSTLRRADAVKAAASAGKHVYCEKPTAVDTATALELHRFCAAKGVKSGVVQDKLWLPGLLKLKRAIDNGFFGRIFAVTGEFGYWVFEGTSVPAQRPSWNYRKEEGGGIIIDMLCHWRYVLDNLFGAGKSGELPRGDSYSGAGGRSWQTLRRHRRRCRLFDVRTGRAGRRDRGEFQFLLGDPGAPGRPAHPACGRRERIGRGRSAGMPAPALQ